MPVRHELAASALTDLLFEDQGVGRCVVAPDGSVIRANAEWLRSTGFEMDHVLGADIIALFPETRDMAVAMHARARAGHRVDVPRHAQRMNGRETWWEGNIASIPMEGGTGLLITAREITDTVSREVAATLRDDSGADGAPRFVGTTHDLTDRKRVEEELRSASQRVDSLLQNSPLAVIEWSPAEFRITRWSDEATRMFGWTAEETVGRRIDELNWVHAEDWPVVEQLMADMLSGKRPRNVTKNRNVRKDGTVIHCEWYNSTVTDSTGELASALSLVLDVTERKLADDALRHSETRFRTLFETMSDGFALDEIICDEQGKPCDLRYLDVNPAFERHTGLRAADIVGRTIRELFPDAEPEWFERYGNVALTGEPAHFEAPFGPLGKWFEVSAYRTEPGRFAAVFFDITERKRAKEALLGSEQRLRALADSMAQLAWTARPDGFIDWYNQRWYQYTGTTPQQMEGWGWQSVHDPATLPDVLRRWKESITTSTAFEMEFPLRGADGKFRRFLTRVFPLKDSGGNVTQWFGTNTDVTELVEAQEGLAVFTRLYAVLSSVNEAIVRTRDERSLYEEVCRIVAEEGRFPLVWVGLVNGREIAPAASWGRATEYLREIKVEVAGELGHGPTGTCVREDRPVINDDFGVNPSTSPWRQATMGHGLRASAAFPLHRCGEVIGALTFYAAKPGAFTAEQVRLLEALCADISYALDAMQHERLRAQAERALRESEQSLREADRRKDEFLGMLSHELRNPLAPIRNSVYILKHGGPTGEQADRARNVIERQAEHLTRLVDDLLDVTRIARGKIELRWSRLDLRDVVLRAADDFGMMMEERGLAFHLAVPPAKVWADADSTRLTQVLGNLLHNAAKFTRRGAEVTLSLREVDGHAELSVRDTGAGIDPAFLPKVFDAFVQGERTLARTEGGLGLGLALVKGIAELHGGTVRAASAGIGKGAEFVVRLPLARARSSEDERREAVPRGKRERRVLVVDDNRDAAESLAEIVEMLGYIAEIAYDGPSAIAKARTSRPEVVLCDIGLPGMSGYDVAKALRSNAANGIRLIAVTGYAQPEDVKLAADAGFDAHIAKPARVDELLALLAKGS